MNREYRIEDLTEEETAYIGRKINEIVPHEVDADEEEFILKVENENGEIIGGCIAEAYEFYCDNETIPVYMLEGITGICFEFEEDDSVDVEEDLEKKRISWISIF